MARFATFLRPIMAAIPSRCAFGASATASPCWRGEGAPAFNLSIPADGYWQRWHRGASAVGADVEMVRPMSRIVQLAQIIAGGAELAGWTALSPGEHGPAFFDLWAREEAVVNATGEGLARGLPEVMVGSGQAIVRLAGVPALEVRSLDCCPGYAAAIAADAPLGKLAVTELVSIA